MKKTIEEATKVAVELSEHLDPKEQAMFIAGFRTCFQWQEEQPQSDQMYSEEDMIKFGNFCLMCSEVKEDWFTQYKSK